MNGTRLQVLHQNINFAIAVCFIASFGLFMITMVFKVAHVQNSIAKVMTAGAVSDTYDRTN